MTPPPIQILLLDPSPLIYAGFERLIEPFSNELKLLPFCPISTEIGFHLPPSEFPDLLLFDATLPAAEQLAGLKTVPKRIAFVYRPDSSMVKKWFRQGVSGVLCKSATGDEILTAVRAVRDGQIWLQPQLQRLFAEQTIGLKPKSRLNNNLTPREKEVLSLITNECTTSEISKKLFISQCTVETHRLHLIQKLGVKNTAGLVRVAFSSGLV